MDWSNERYVRLYTRDTDDWEVLPWQAKATWALLLRKLDRAGVYETKYGAMGVSRATDLPLEVVQIGLPALLADGCLIEHPNGYVAPNYIEANETPQTDAHRAREYRARRREVAVSQNVTPSQNVTLPSRNVTTSRDDVTPRDATVTKRDDVTKRDAAITKRDDTVTKRDEIVTRRHAPSRAVTPSLPYRSDLNPPTLISEGVWVSYVQAYTERYGSPPTLTEGAEAKLRLLVSQHGEEEVLRRAKILLHKTPDWIKGPCDVDTLFRLFDKLVGERQPPRRSNGVSPVRVDDDERRAAAEIAAGWIAKAES